MRKYIAFCFVLCSGFSLVAQDFGFGVKAGLAYSTLNGDTDPGESYGYKSGFHVGPTFTFKYTDNFGFRAELLYNQLGTKYEYEGRSYFELHNDLESRAIVGDKDVNYNTYMSYVDIPVQVYYRIGDVLEIYGGVNFMILGGGTAGGNLKFNNPSLRPNDIDVRLDYSYNSDKARTGEGSLGTTYSFNGNRFDVPESLGAYYDHEEKDGRSFSTLDYGIHGGLRVFFNDALYLEGRAYFGFNDVTNNDLDRRQYIETGEPLRQLSEDDDRNMAFSLSLGFSF